MRILHLVETLRGIEPIVILGVTAWSDRPHSASGETIECRTALAEPILDRLPQQRRAAGIACAADGTDANTGPSSSWSLAATVTRSSAPSGAPFARTTSTSSSPAAEHATRAATPESASAPRRLRCTSSASTARSSAPVTVIVSSRLSNGKTS